MYRLRLTVSKPWRRVFRARRLSQQHSLKFHKMQAEFDRRKKDWQQQQRLAKQGCRDSGRSAQQADSACEDQTARREPDEPGDRSCAVGRRLPGDKVHQRRTVRVMSRILQGLYAEQLQRATATARPAQQQFAFDLLLLGCLCHPDELLEHPGPECAAGSTPSSSAGPDRKGPTGAERLLADIEQFDNIAAQQTTRKFSYADALSLATVAPGDFHGKRKPVRWFQTTEKDPRSGVPRTLSVGFTKSGLSGFDSGGQRNPRATLTNVDPVVTVPGTAGFARRHFREQ